MGRKSYAKLILIFRTAYALLIRHPYGRHLPRWGRLTVNAPYQYNIELTNKLKKYPFIKVFEGVCGKAFPSGDGPDQLLLTLCVNSPSEGPLAVDEEKILR